MRKIAKKKVAAVAGALVLTSAGVAYAYWTTSGSGSGSASTGTSTAITTVTQDSNLNGYVLGESRDVFVKVNNPANSQQSVGNVTLSVAAAGDCAATNWEVTDVADTIGVIPASSSSASTKVATLKLLDLATNQDACKGVAPVLTYTVAPGS